MADSMRAWAVQQPGPVARHPLVLATRPVPVPASDEILVRVDACGLCRTDLHLAEGDLEPRRNGVVPGHQVVGRVVDRGADTRRFAAGDRVGIAWLRSTCGACRWCRSGAENLCPDSRYTGWDADGGFAEYAVVPAAYAYALPESIDDERVAPLLCAGIIGYRALRRAELPSGGRLGILGFGSSAHITAQIAIAQGAEVHVMTRGEDARLLATWTWAPRGPVAHEIFRPSSWTPRSCSRLPATWCRRPPRPRPRRDTGAGRDPHEHDPGARLRP